MFQEPAEALFTADVFGTINSWRLFLPRADESVVYSLVWAALVIVDNELAHNMVEVLKTEDDEVIESFVLQTLNPPLDESVQVGCPRPDMSGRDDLARCVE